MRKTEQLTSDEINILKNEYWFDFEWIKSVNKWIEDFNEWKIYSQEDVLNWLWVWIYNKNYA